MKDTVLDVLVYLYEHYIDIEPDAARDRESLQAELLEAGFSPSETGKALDWLDELAARQPRGDGRPGAMLPVRLFAPQELDRLDLECRGFLLRLEQRGVLDAARRELVLERLAALELETLDVTDLKWVVLLVLANQPGQEAAYAWIEGELLADGGESVH